MTFTNYITPSGSYVFPEIGEAKKQSCWECTKKIKCPAFYLATKEGRITPRDITAGCGCVEFSDNPSDSSLPPNENDFANHERYINSGSAEDFFVNYPHNI